MQVHCIKPLPQWLCCFENEQKLVSRKQQLTIVVWSEEFKDGDTYIELHVVSRWFKVEEARPSMYFFDPATEQVEAHAPPQQQSTEMPVAKIGRVAALGSIRQCAQPCGKWSHHRWPQYVIGREYPNNKQTNTLSTWYLPPIYICSRSCTSISF